MPISTKHRDSGDDGNACIDRGDRQSWGSSDIIRTVLSAKPMAKNIVRISFGATAPNAMHNISDGIRFLSVYSFNWPVCEQIL